MPSLSKKSFHILASRHGSIQRFISYILIKPHSIKPNGLTPTPFIPDISTLYIKPPRPDSVIGLRSIPRKRRGNDIKHPLVVSNRRRPDSTPRLGSLDLELRWPGQCMADESPFYQILAVVDWGGGRVFECGCYEEVVRSDADYGWVWV